MQKCIVEYRYSDGIGRCGLNCRAETKGWGRRMEDEDKGW